MDGLRRTDETRRAMSATTNAADSTKFDIAFHTKRIENLQREHVNKEKELYKFGLAIEKMQNSLAQSQQFFANAQQSDPDRYRPPQSDLGITNGRPAGKSDEGCASKACGIKTCRQVSNALDQSFPALNGSANPDAGQIHPDRLMMMHSKESPAGSDYAPPPASITTARPCFANHAEPGRLSPYQDLIAPQRSHEKRPERHPEADTVQRSQTFDRKIEAQEPLQIASPAVVGRPNSVLWSDQTHQDQIRLAAAFNHAVMRAASLTMFIVPVPYNETFKRFDMLRLARKLREPEGYQTATSVLLAPIHYQARVLEATQIARLVPDMLTPDDELRGMRQYLSTQAAFMTMGPEPARKHSNPDPVHEREHKRLRVDSSLGWRPDLAS